VSGFRTVLGGEGLRIIAEVKRRSPSAGPLRPDADAARLASEFEDAGAAALSVLVDGRFDGDIEDLRAARAATTIPILAKGFFRTEAELAEVRAAGADAALLILADLDDATAARLLAFAGGLGLETLVEAHDAEELSRAVALRADPIGINARDLRTYRVDRPTQLDLVARAPRDRVIVAESGIHTRAQAASAEIAGADAILVGSALMRSSDPGAKLDELVRRPLVKVCGLTREEDVAAAAEAGVDLVGFVLAESPRRVEEPLPVQDTMLSVAIFVGNAEPVETDLSQVYPRENGHRARDGLLLENRRGCKVAEVVDLPWLGDDPRHWSRASARQGRVMLAGRLGPHNVRAAVRQVKPWCVDASRSLESAPGIKDHERMRAFVEAAR
jgi:indole-3-glycerol phosphate synthase / phosphoribosylanthranilate isomerase